MTLYKNRIVIFLDILGFKNAIINNHPSSFIYMNFKSVLGDNKQFTNILEMKKVSSDVSITLISDSIVLSVLTETENSLTKLFDYMIGVAYRNIGCNFLVRGGMAIGELYHDNEMVFGPALVNAYELESKKSIYPRITVSKETLEQLSVISITNKDIINKYFIEDYDGQVYLDILSYANSEYSYNNWVPYLMNNYCNVMRGGLMNSESRRVREKFLWVYKYCFNWANKNLSDSEYKFLPEPWAEVFSLPDGDKEYSFTYVLYGIVINAESQIAFLDNKLISISSEVEGQLFNNLCEIISKYNSEVEYKTHIKPSIRCYVKDGMNIHERADWLIFRTNVTTNKGGIEWKRIDECENIPNFQYSYIMNNMDFIYRDYDATPAYISNDF